MTSIKRFIAESRKAISAVITGVIGWAAVVIASPDAAIMASEYLMLATVVATALGVYTVPNARRVLRAPGHDN